MRLLILPFITRESNLNKILFFGPERRGKERRKLGLKIFWLHFTEHLSGHRRPRLLDMDLPTDMLIFPRIPRAWPTFLILDVLLTPDVLQGISSPRTSVPENMEGFYKSCHCSTQRLCPPPPKKRNKGAQTTFFTGLTLDYPGIFWVCVSLSPREGPTTTVLTPAHFWDTLFMVIDFLPPSESHRRTKSNEALWKNAEHKETYKSGDARGSGLVVRVVVFSDDEASRAISWLCLVRAHA